MTPSALDLRLLRMFEAIHAQRHVTRAADVLGVGQPTLSIGLRQLRAHFADPLFVKTAQGMLPTPRADALIQQVREILQRVDDLSAGEATFDHATVQRHFRIAMTDASHITLLPQLLSAVRSRAPGVTLEATGIDATLATALESGQIALALGLIPQLATDVYQQSLYEQDFVCLTRKTHPVLQGTLTELDYRALHHVAIVSGTGQKLLEKALEAANIERRIALRLPGFLGLPAIIASSDLIATLPRHIGSTLAAIGALAIHECPFQIARFSVKLHWHSRFHGDPANQWLRRLALELFRQR